MKFSLGVRCLPIPPLLPPPPPRVPVDMWSEFLLEYHNVVYLLQLEIFYSASKGYSLASKEYN